MSVGTRLTPMEELMLHQDSEAYPCAIFVRLSFQGKISQLPFEQAVAAAVKRHPLLNACVDRTRRIPIWQSPVDQPVPIVWQDAILDDSFPPHEYLDVAREGLRLLVVRGSQNSQVVLHVHHACCDGLGVYQFVQDLLVLYAIEIGGDISPDRLAELRPDSLDIRARLELDPWRLMRMLPRQLVGLHGVAKFLLHSPIPVVPHRRVATAGPPAAPYPAALSHRFDLATSQALGAVAKSRNATTNELLCSCLFKALHAFRRAKGVAHDDHWLRLMIPMNLRREVHRHVPAANVVSAIFLDRQGKSMDNPARLLSSIHDEMQIIKSNQLGYTFLISLYTRRLLPGGIRSGARKRGEQCNASAVFTNVGRVLADTPLPWEGDKLRCGNVLLERADMLAPLTPYTCAAFGASWFADRLAITLHFDPRPLSMNDAQALLQEFVQQIQDATECGANLD